MQTAQHKPNRITTIAKHTWSFKFNVLLDKFHFHIHDLSCTMAVERFEKELHFKIFILFVAVTSHFIFKRMANQSSGIASLFR